MRHQLHLQVKRARTSAFSLLGHLARLRKAVETALAMDEGAREDAVGAAIQAFQADLATKQLAAQRKTLRDLLRTEPALCEYGNDAWAVADGLAELENYWPHQKQAGNRDAVLAAIGTSSEALNDLVFHCSMVTMPTEVSEQLDLLRVGKPLDFHQTFAPQLPNAEQRNQLLTRLKHLRICGWVDTASGLIYRLPQRESTRILTCLAPFLVALLVGAGLWGFSFVNLHGGDWSGLQKGGELLGAYGLVLAGAVFHLIVENVKQDQIGKASIGAISDTIYWFNLRWAGLSATVFWVLVVTIGLRLSDMGSEGSDLALYFFAGYSLDSVAGLVLTRFVNSSQAAVGQIEAQLGPAPAGGTAQQPVAAPATS